MRLSPRYIITNILNNAIYIYIHTHHWHHWNKTASAKRPQNRMCHFFFLLSFAEFGYHNLEALTSHTCRCGCRVLFYPLSEVGHTLGFKMSPRSKSFLPFALLGLFRGHFTFSLFHLLVKIFCKLQKLVKYTPSLFPRVPSHTLLRFEWIKFQIRQIIRHLVAIPRDPVQL